MRDLLKTLETSKILLGDGAMGTQLQEAGWEMGDCPESWNEEYPEKVLAILAGYVDAGSDLIETNTFGGSAIKLGDYQLQDKTESYNSQAAQVGRAAAGEDTFVLGSVGPTGHLMEPLGPIGESDMIESFARQVRGLAEGGVDAVCIETMMGLDEALAALKAAKDNTDLPVIVTFTFDRGPEGQFRSMMGVSPTQAAEELTAAGADIVGSNCGLGIEDMIGIASELRQGTDGFIMVQPNAGIPIMEKGRTIYPSTPIQMAEQISQLVEAGAINILGGCCGTTTDHIRAFRRTIDQLGLGRSDRGNRSSANP